MRVWRVVTLLLLLVFAGLPLAAPFIELLLHPAALEAWSELPRLAELAGNSLVLAGGTLLLVMPAGVLGGILLFRTNLPGAALWRFLAVFALFIPLPIVTSAWQMALGLFIHGPGGTPLWPEGFLPAIGLHALISLPWVIVLVGLGLRWVEPELEEDALLITPAWRVVLGVSLPRAAPALLLAALWTVLQTLNELTTVTDTLVVRTFGEEVCHQFSFDAQTGGPRALAVSLPALIVMCVIVLFVTRHWRRVVPPRQAVLAGPRVFSLGRARWLAFLGLMIVVAFLAAVPLAGLTWKAGLRYSTAASPGPPVWDVRLLLERLVTTAVRQRGVLFNSLIIGMGTGMFVGVGALWTAWLARRSRWFESVSWFLAAALWALPGPVLGVGLLAAEQWLFDVDGSGLLKMILWERPSPLPSLWVCVLRFLPIGLIALAPLVRLVPMELEESAELDGATPWQRFSRVSLPVLRRPLLWTILGVGVLALGELSASKLVATPGFETLAPHVFMQMHYGADAELAALCLVLLSVVVAGGALVAATSRWLARGLTRVAQSNSG